MAERRMFAKSVIGSARFLKMPASARLLYYDLGMEADDDGCVEAFGVMRKTGAAEDDLRVLHSKGFIKILNDDLVTYISDWNTNNKIRKDRYHEGLYKDLLSGNCPVFIECEAHDNQVATKWQPSDNQMATEDRLGKVSIGKVSKEYIVEQSLPKQTYNYDFFKETYNKSSNLPACRSLTEKRKKAIRSFLKDFTQEQWQEVCEKANLSPFLTGKNERKWKADIDFLLRPEKAAKILEGQYGIEKKTEHKPGIEGAFVEVE